MGTCNVGKIIYMTFHMDGVMNLTKSLVEIVIQMTDLAKIVDLDLSLLFLIVRLLEVMDFMLMIKIAESISNVLVGFLIFILATLDYCIDQVTFNVIMEMIFIQREHANHVFANVMMEFKMKFVA